jgi:hypothetical protein
VRTAVAFGRARFLAPITPRELGQQSLADRAFGDLVHFRMRTATARPARPMKLVAQQPAGLARRVDGYLQGAGIVVGNSHDLASNPKSECRNPKQVQNPKSQ